MRRCRCVFLDGRHSLIAIKAGHACSAKLHQKEQMHVGWPQRLPGDAARGGGLGCGVLTPDHALAHILGVAPYLLFLACPLMHLFMHRGHKHRGHHHVRMRNDEDAKAGKT
jgi:hypothetical protein